MTKLYRAKPWKIWVSNTHDEELKELYLPMDIDKERASVRAVLNEIADEEAKDRRMLAALAVNAEEGTFQGLTGALALRDLIIQLQDNLIEREKALRDLGELNTTRSKDLGETK